MAVYTHLTRETVSAYLSSFDIGALVSLSGISDGVENSNYLMETTSGKYILTLVEKRTPPEALPFCIGYMSALNTAGVPCPAVIADKDGRLINQLQGRPAIITTFLQGGWLKETTPAHLAAVGAILGKMHRVGTCFPTTRANPMGVETWQHLIGLSLPRADNVQQGLGTELSASLRGVISAWPSQLPTGAVHADLFPDNVFFSGHGDTEKLSGVIDFYFSCTEMLAYDLMLTLNAWCFDTSGHLDTAKSAALLQSYHRERALSDAEIAALPILGQGAALRIIATRLYDWLHPAAGAVVTPKNPLEHVHILRFHQKVSGAADYGFLP